MERSFFPRWQRLFFFFFVPVFLLPFFQLLARVSNHFRQVVGFSPLPEKFFPSAISVALATLEEIQNSCPPPSLFPEILTPCLFFIFPPFTFLNDRDFPIYIFEIFSS